MAKEVQLLQSVDPDGNPIALLRKEADGRYIILAPVNQGTHLPAAVDVSEAEDDVDLKSKVGGEIVAIDAGAFDAQLDEWGYDGSDAYRSDGRMAENETEAESTDEDVDAEGEEGFEDETRTDNDPGARTEGGTIANDPNHAESTGVDPEGDQPDVAGPETKSDEEMHGETERQSAQDETKKEQAGI